MANETPAPLPGLSPAARAGLSILADDARQTKLARWIQSRQPSSPAGIQLYAALIWIRNLELLATVPPPAGGASPLPLSVRFGLVALARRVDIEELADHLALRGASETEVDAITEALTWILLGELSPVSESEATV